MDDGGNLRTTIAAALSDTTDYIAATMPSVNMVMDGYYQQFQKDTSSYFENVLHNLQKIHQDAFDRREQELYRQIAELQGQVLDLQEQLTAMTEKCSGQQQLLDKQKEKSIDRQHKKYRVHTSPWGLKRVFLAWKTLTKRSKQRGKTEKLLDRWEKKYYTFRTVALWNSTHKALKYDHGLSENKFKYETLSNEMVAHYETEQSKLQNDLHDAYTLIKKEEQKRLQLEEAMRKMFVKNMNTMNMEALSIFQSINKFDPSDVLSVQQAYQQHQQAALNAMMAAATATPEGYQQPPSTGGGSMAGPAPADNGVVIPPQYQPDPQQSAPTSSHANALPRSDSVSSMAPPPPAAAMAMGTVPPSAGFADSSNQQGNPLYLAQLSQPPVYSSNQMYGMFSPGPPPPPPNQAVYSTYQSVPMQQQQQQQQMFAGMQDAGANSQPPMGVRFEMSGTPSGSTYATPMKTAQAGIYEMSGNVQDREYLDRLAEQYRQSTSATARFAQNVPPGATYQPQGVQQPSMSTPMRPMGTAAGPPVSAASSLGSHPTPQGAQSGVGAPSFLSGYSIRRK